MASTSPDGKRRKTNESEDSKINAMMTTSSEKQEPSSTSSASHIHLEYKNKLIESLRNSLREKESKLQEAMNFQGEFLKELTESVECPVCFNIPRKPPVDCCMNGHVICSRCRGKLESCPKCRIPLTNCVSQVAATVIQRIQHPCDFRDRGCVFKSHIRDISNHEKSCQFRLVPCPHWACDETVSLDKLTKHVIDNECGDNYRDKPLPYKEEMEYARNLDDEEGNGFWRPSLLQYDGITFYVQVEKCGKSRNWYFYIQKEGNGNEDYMTKISVGKYSTEGDDRHSIIYNGFTCPIDVKGATEVMETGTGLNIRDAVMERIFVPEKNCDDNEDRFKFWLSVDIYKA